MRVDPLGDVEVGACAAARSGRESGSNPEVRSIGRPYWVVNTSPSSSHRSSAYTRSTTRSTGPRRHICVGPGGVDDEPVGNTLHGLRDLDGNVLEVDIRPAQAA